MLRQGEYTYRHINRLKYYIADSMVIFITLCQSDGKNGLSLKSLNQL